MSFQTEIMTVNKIEIVNFHSVDCFKASFKKSVNVIDGKNALKVLEIIFFLISGNVPDFEKPTESPSFVRAECSVGTDKFRIEIQLEEGKYVIHSPLHKINSIEQKMCSFGLNKNDWSKELYSYLHQDEYYPYNRLSKLTSGASTTHSFRAFLNWFADRERANGVLNSKGVFIRQPEKQKADFQYFCFEKTLEFWDSFNEIRSPGQAVSPIIIWGVEKSKINLSGRQIFVG